MTNLIINADDFGMSREVNEGIETGIKRGIIRNVSVIANMPYFSDAVSFLKKHPEVSVGLHFNITEGQPVLPPNEVDTLIKEDGSFFYWTSLIPRLVVRNAKLEQIKKELFAQFAKLKSTGLPITHIDSHHHIHIYPHVFTFFTKFAQAKKVMALRCHHFNPWSLTAGFTQWPNWKKTIINLLMWTNSSYNNRLRHDFVNGEVDGLYDLNWDKNLAEKDLQIILARLPQGTTEIICHLGVLSPNGNSRFLLPRFRTLRLLSKKSIKNSLISNGIKLVRR